MIELKEQFKNRFSTALELRNIRPVDLSKITGISESTISQYRSGYSKPKRDRLVVIANALMVDPSWLMGFDVPMFPRQKHDGEMGKDAEAVAIDMQEAAMLIEAMNEENRRKALGYLERLLAIQAADREVTQ